MIKLERRFMFLVDKRFDNLYRFLSEQGILFQNELFVFSLLVGNNFNYSKELSYRSIEKNIQINSTAIKKEYLTPLFSVIIEKYRDVDFLTDEQKIFKYKRELEEYANGGLEIICKEVFGGNWNGYELNPNYDNYEFDILLFLVQSKWNEVLK